MSTSKVLAVLCATAALSAGVGLAYCWKRLNKSQEDLKQAEEKLEEMSKASESTSLQNVDLSQQLDAEKAQAKMLYEMCEQSVFAMQRNGDMARKFLLAWRRISTLHASVLDTLAHERNQPTSELPQYLTEGSLGYIAHRLKHQLSVKDINSMLHDLGVSPLSEQQASVDWLTEPY